MLLSLILGTLIWTPGTYHVPVPQWTPYKTAYVQVAQFSHGYDVGFSTKRNCAVDAACNFGTYRYAGNMTGMYPENPRTVTLKDGRTGNYGMVQGVLMLFVKTAPHGIISVTLKSGSLPDAIRMLESVR